MKVFRRSKYLFKFVNLTSHHNSSPILLQPDTKQQNIFGGTKRE